LRAEDLELGNPIPVADVGQASLVHLNTRDDQHGPRLAPMWIISVVLPATEEMVHDFGALHGNGIDLVERLGPTPESGGLAAPGQPVSGLMQDPLIARR
jgi:hypothetical protein